MTARMGQAEQPKDQAPRVALGLIGGNEEKTRWPMSESSVWEAGIQAGTASKGRLTPDWRAGGYSMNLEKCVYAPYTRTKSSSPQVAAGKTTSA